MMSDKLYTVAEYSKEKRLSKKTIYKKIEAGQLEYVYKPVNNKQIKFIIEKEKQDFNPNLTEGNNPINPNLPHNNPNLTEEVNQINPRLTEGNNPINPAGGSDSAKHGENEAEINENLSITFLLEQIKEKDSIIKEKESIIKEKDIQIIELSQKIADIADKALTITSQGQYIQAFDKSKEIENKPEEKNKNRPFKAKIHKLLNFFEDY